MKFDLNSGLWLVVNPWLSQGVAAMEAIYGPQLREAMAGGGKHLAGEVYKTKNIEVDDKVAKALFRQLALGAGEAEAAFDAEYARLTAEKDQRG